MSILCKYWVREFIRYFFIVQFIVLCIFISVDYLTNMDKFLRAELPLLDAFGYVLLKIPHMFVLLTPAGTVLSVIVVFSLMNRNNELLAMKGSGISAYYLVRPAAVAGIVLAAMMFFLGETLVPMTMSRVNTIKYTVLKKDRRIVSVKEDVWIKGDQKIAHFRYFNPKDQTIAGVSFTVFNKDFSLKTRVDASWGRYIDGQWRLANVLEQQFGPSSDQDTIFTYDLKDYALEFKPEDLQRIAKKSDEMSFSGLAEYIRKVESEGYDATVYKVDLFGKTAFPFICLIMVMTGASAGMRPFARENMPLGIALGLVVSFGYWVMFGFCTSLGYGRMLPPFISAWAANIFFFCFAAFYLVTSGD